MSNVDDELAFSSELVGEIAKKDPFRPLVRAPDVDLIDVAASTTHAENLQYLQEYLILAEDSSDLNETTGPKTLAQLSHGFRKAGEFAAAANCAWKNAKAAKKRAEAVAALDNFREYVSQKKADGITVKVTEPVREHYINIDEGVIKAVEQENLLEAFKEQMLTIKFEFAMAISNVRAIVYGHKDSNTISGSSMSVNDQE